MAELGGPAASITNAGAGSTRSSRIGDRRVAHARYPLPAGVGQRLPLAITENGQSRLPGYRAGPGPVTGYYYRGD